MHTEADMQTGSHTGRHSGIAYIQAYIQSESVRHAYMHTGIQADRAIQGLPDTYRYLHIYKQVHTHTMFY